MATVTTKDTSLSYLFAQTGGSGDDPLDPTAPGLQSYESDSKFMKDFKTPYTGTNGSGPILNANANLLPTRTDRFRDISSTIDYKLNNGLGLSKAYQKQDSMPGNSDSGFYGFANPTKMFGRDSKSYDLNYLRNEATSRAAMSFKKMGFKPDEVPLGGALFPWDWNNNQVMGIGGIPIGNPNQYNRNHSLPDADAVARRLYTPAPSRLTKLITTDVENAALRPNRTLMHPETVVSNDLQREKLQRPSRNADVIESVQYENIAPRGMGSRVEASMVYGDVDVLRQPIGTNETGSRAVYGQWKNGFSAVNPLLDVSLEDKLQMFKDDYRYVQGKDCPEEFIDYKDTEKNLLNQLVPDPTHVQPGKNEFIRDASTPSVPLLRLPQYEAIFN